MGLSYEVGAYTAGVFDDGMCRPGDWWSPEKIVLQRPICSVEDGKLIADLLREWGSGQTWKDVSVDISGGYAGDSVDIQLWGYRIETDEEYAARIEELNRERQKEKIRAHRQREVAQQLAVMRR